MTASGFIDIMPWRLANLEATVKAYLATGAPLVRVTETGLYAAANPTDDPGIFLGVPVIARVTGLSTAASKDVFIVGILLVALALGIWGAIAGARTRAGKFVCVAGLTLLAVVAGEVGDVYSISAAILMGGVPWLMFGLRRPGARALMTMAPLFGVACAAANLVRGQSGTALALMFAAGLLLKRDVTWRQRMIGLGLAAGGLALIGVLFGTVVAHRDAFLATAPKDPTPQALGHPFWHTVYIGLGFVENPYGLRYDDTVATAFVAQSLPDEPLGSPRYEDVLRQEVFRIAATDPGFIFRVEAAKALRVLLYFLAFANIGILAWTRVRVAPAIWASLVLGLLFTALPAFVAIPRPDYLLGFIAMATLTSLVGIDEALAGLPKMSET